MAPQRVFSGTPWESAVGYCRALRVGSQILVSGTAPSDGQGGTVAPGDGYAQTHRCLTIIEEALEELGASLADVVRTRMYVTDIGQWEAIAKAHQERFGDHPPTSTMVEVAGLINPDMVIEIEAEAYSAPLALESPPEAPTMTRRAIFGRPIQPGGYPYNSTYPPTTAQDLDEGCLD